MKQGSIKNHKIAKAGRASDRSLQTEVYVFSLGASYIKKLSFRAALIVSLLLVRAEDQYFLLGVKF